MSGLDGTRKPHREPQHSGPVQSEPARVNIRNNYSRDLALPESLQTYALATPRTVLMASVWLQPPGSTEHGWCPPHS